MNKYVFDLFYFNEGEEEVFDIDTEIEAFEKEWEESIGESAEGAETDETESETEEQEIQESTEQQEEKEEGKDETIFPTEKQNRAFAEMRRQLEEEQKYANIIRRIAEQNGVDPEEIVRQFEQRQLQKEAEEQNVPVEVLQRMKQLEMETQMLKKQTLEEKFNQSVEETKKKFNLSESDINEVFKGYREHGWDPNTINFEQAYKLLNFDKIMEQKVHEERQKEIEAKRKRRENATVPNGEGAKPDTSTELTDELHEKILEDMGLLDKINM